MNPEKEICPYCSAPVAQGPEALRCRSCGARHHRDCWSENGGCAVVGCDEGHGRAQPPPPPPTNVKSTPGVEATPRSAAPPPPLPGSQGQSILPWVALFLAGIAVVVVVTLLVLGGGDGGDGGDDLIPPPDEAPKTKKPDRDPEPDPGPPSAAEIEILRSEGYDVDCEDDVFGDNTSPNFCRAVAAEARSRPRAGLLVPIQSRSTPYAYTMNCRPYTGQADLPRYRVCVEVGTTDPGGIDVGGIAEVILGP